VGVRFRITQVGQRSLLLLGRPQQLHSLIGHPGKILNVLIQLLGSEHHSFTIELW
jgi:hypothetical protein